MPPGWSLSPVRQKEEEALMTREPDLETVNRALAETVRKLQKDLADALNAWPGAELDPYPQGTGKKTVVKWYLDLPLTQENSNGSD
jgi:hypothetical protein